MKDPSIRCVIDVIVHAQTTEHQLPDGRYVPARPIGWGGMRHRIKATWLVWTGRADALVWPGQ
jgi:hypothetical protein